MAPEVIKKDWHSYEVDVWAIGVIIYKMIIGEDPFKECEGNTVKDKILMSAYSFPDNIDITDSARDLITKILNNDPKMRPTID